MGKHSDWKKAGTGLVDRLFKYRFVQQFAALSYKNGLVAWRSRRSTGLRLCAPFIFLLLALITHLALNANNALQERFVAVHESVGAPIPPIPACGDDLYIAGRPCVDFVWTPSNDTGAQAIVDAIRSHNDPPIPPDKVVGFRTRREADDYMMSHPDGCLGAVHFSRSGPGTFSYVITSNSTVKYFKGSFQDPVNFFQMPMMNAVARELARSYVTAAAAADNSSSSSSGFAWSPQLVRFPHPSLQSMNLLGQVLASFIFASLMFNCVSQISGLVCERDAGLRLSLSNMGMSQAAYWTSWMAFDVLLTAATALLLVVAGIVLRFDFFVKNDFGLLLLLFWLFSLAMTSFSYALSCLVKKPQGAMYLGFSVFIVGWMFQTIQFLAKLPYSPATYFSTTNRWGRVFFWLFALYPWNGLTKGILDLNEATLSPADPGLRASQLYDYCRYEPDPGAQPPYDPRQEFRSYDCIYPLWQVYLTLLCQWVGYWLLAVYLSNVLPNEVGARRPLLYPLQPSYWWPQPGDTAAELQQLLADEAAGVGSAPPAAGGHQVDPDVEAEEAKMRALLEARAGLTSALHCKDPSVQSSSSSSTGGQYAAELYGLSKVFKGGPTPLSCRPAFMCMPCMTARADEDTDEDRLLQAVTAGASSSSSSSSRRASSGGHKREDFWALRGTWLGIERGRLFCLLGPNGAGKTTTINCLTGVLPFSGGAALIYGNSIASEAGLDAVRPLMGVCPQFDVLWPELSGREHLVIAGHIKGRPWNKVSSEASDLLGRVQLAGSAGVRSGAYSGGMKRRLSVALALLGDPRIVYLDEPTTGMDPISRRHVWDIITAAKPGRAIVLTTHSMEEADVLGDRIAIMARGRIRALGSSIRLKQKYGSGYQLSVHVGLPPSVDRSRVTAGQQQQQLAQQVELVRQVFRSGLGLEAVDESRGVLRYLVPQSVPQATLVGFLSSLEASAGHLGVDDIQASLASLEEVFLNIAKQAELEAAAASGSSLVGVDLPGGGTLMVPLGEEEVIGPDGSAYSINWSQDDQGRLVVLSCTVKLSEQQQQQCVVLEGLQEQQDPALQQQQQQQQQQWTPQQQQQQHGSQLGGPDMPGVQMQQHSPVGLGQGVHARHHHHQQELSQLEQQQQQQQQQSGPVHAASPAQQAAAVLPVGCEGAVSEAHLPRLSECIRAFTPRSTPGSKPHDQ